MRAVHLIDHIGPDGIEIVDIDEPTTSKNQVVVDLHASGVAYPDLLQTRAGYQVVHELPAVLGMEGAGTVRTAPPGCGFEPGDRVAVLGDGTWQRTVSVEPHSVFALPATVSTHAGAGMLLNYLTAEFVLNERARCRRGETVLVQGAAGGIGVATLSVAKALGLTSIAVVSSTAKARAALENGATHIVNAGDFRTQVREITGGRGVDIVVDPVGGDRFLDSLRTLATGGRLIVVGFAAGDIPTVKVNRLLLQNTAVIGAGWAEFIRADPGYPSTQWRTLKPLLEKGTLRVPEPTVYPLDRAAAALRLIDDRAAIGKIVLDFTQ
jgi:NADPH:quinone reductase